MYDSVHKPAFTQNKNKLNRNKLNKTTTITYISAPLVPRLRKDEQQSTTTQGEVLRNSGKKGVDKLLNARSDAKRSDYKTNRKTGRNIRKHRPLHAIKLIND